MSFELSKFLLENKHEIYPKDYYIMILLLYQTIVSHSMQYSLH